MLYENFARLVLFRLGRGDAEIAHDKTLQWLASAARFRGLLSVLRKVYRLEVPREVFGLRFPNPVGLAAGLDKDGEALVAWPALGFGFIEVGTVTPERQEGNVQPRLFRLAASQAVINRMGFKNIGAPALADRLTKVGRLDAPLGVSLGKSKDTPVDHAVADYLTSLRLLYRHGDYFVVNVSSPNTPGLRSLQGRELLSELLAELRRESASLAEGGAPKPLLVKIAPDLTDAAIADAIEVCRSHGVAGLIATNTTLNRDGLAPHDRARAAEAGGLSGRPLTTRAREVVSFVHRETDGRLPIIGVGGILDPDDALRLLDSGASLVQICTGLIYRGPGLVKAINTALAQTPSRTAQDRISSPR